MRLFDRYKIDALKLEATAKAVIVDSSVLTTSFLASAADRKWPVKNIVEAIQQSLEAIRSQAQISKDITAKFREDGKEQTTRLAV